MLQHYNPACCFLSSAFDQRSLAFDQNLLPLLIARKCRFVRSRGYKNPFSLFFVSF